MTTFTCMQIVLMGGMLATGSINTLCRKTQNDFIVQGYKSPPHSFKHPWVQTWMISIAMSLSVIGLFFQRRRELQEYKKQVQHTQISEAETGTVQSQIEIGPPVTARMFQWILLIPACTYIIANSLAGIGLLYVDASVFVMMRGSIVVFTGILSKVFLKRELEPTHWLGILTVMTGLLLAGCSSLFKSQTHKTYGGGTLSAVHRTLIDACRTIVVWGVGLIVYYAFDKNFGEPFDRSYGILQVDGFLFLVIGTAMYKQLIDIRHFVYFCTLTSENVKVEHNGTGHQGNLHNNSSCDPDGINNEQTNLLQGNRI